MNKNHELEEESNQKNQYNDQGSIQDERIEPSYKDISERIKKVRIEFLNVSRDVVSRDVDVGRTTVQQYENANREPSITFLRRFAKYSGYRLEWLIEGIEPQRETDPVQASDVACSCVDVLGNPVDLSEFVFVPRYDVRAAAGHGAWNDDEKPQFTMAFRRYWIENFLRVSPKDLSVISVKGDSMEGVLNDRDSILVNHADNDPKEGVYVLRIDGHLVVKRIQRLPGEVLKVSSTNPAYEPFTVDMKNPPQDFNVIGKVVWFGRMM